MYSFQHEINKDELPEFDRLTELFDVSLDVADGEGAAQYKLTWFVGPEELSMFQAQLGQMLGAPVQFEQVEAVDWAEQSLNSFQPLTIGPYFIYRNEDDAVPEDHVGLYVPAAQAFGTGEHATTEGCLRLYEELRSDYKFQLGLDMGCGSGILAMAAAKRHGLPFVAADIDQVSVNTARENALYNGVAELVECVHSNGFKAPEVERKSPYDLIFANILMAPLVEMAAELNKHLAEGGVAVLSGFLTEQAEIIRSAYTSQGLVEMGQWSDEDWVALAFWKEK